MTNARGYPMDSSYALDSPDVPVSRADEGSLLDRPYVCSFLVDPGVNARLVLERDPSRRPEIGAAMRERVGRVLAIAASHGHDMVVLGVRGCGAFGNDGEEVAGLFRHARDGVFSRVISAIVDWSEDGHFIGRSRRAFGPSFG